MKTLIEILKTTLLGGLLVLLPLLLLYLMLAEAVELVIMLATPIADAFPEGTFGEIRHPAVLAFLLIIGLSLAIGIAMKAALIRAVGRRIESSILDRMPFYRALANLLRGFVQSDDERAFRAAVLAHSDDISELVYVVEDTGGERVTVLRPHAPMGFVGTIGIVSRDRLTRLESTIGDVSRVFGHWGVGTQELLPPSES